MMNQFPIVPIGVSAVCKSPLRIAFLDSWRRQVFEGSGTTVAIEGLGQALTQLGHDVTHIVPLFMWPRTLTLRRLLFNIQLPALLRALTYDLIVGFDIDGFLWAGTSNGTPYVCSLKGVIAEELRYEHGATCALLRGLAQLEKANARRAALVLVTSQYARDAVHRRYGIAPERVRVVPEGIDLVGWRQALARVDCDRDPFTVLCVARQYPRKQITDLLLAFSLIHRRIPRARAVIVGDGPEHNHLRTFAARLGLNDVVLFTGGLPNADAVVSWYRRSAIFCLPSIQEGFGIVFLEAMVGGLPIVSTTAAAIPEVVQQGQAGILVPGNNPSALAVALVELLEQPDLCARYSAFNQDYVQQFAWERIAECFLHTVAEVL